MGGFTSLATAVSGMRAAQLGLTVTGHNMSNSEIEGYSRQRVIQKEFFYQKIGNTAYGTLRVGLGTDTNAVMQIRNKFLDGIYRTQNSKLQFYSVKSFVGQEIEGLLGEMQGSYNFQTVVNDMWKALQELVEHPNGIETRDYFRATCESFVNKANEVYEGLFEYQRNLDGQIRDAVTNINDLVARVNQLNQDIRKAETNGENANDYRDERNLCLDKLSTIISIDCYEDQQGNINIFSDGHQLLSQDSQNVMGLRYISGLYSLVEPVFTTSTQILPCDTPPADFEQYLDYSKPWNSVYDNDYGTLKALVLARGAMPAYYNGEKNLVEPVKPAALGAGATQAQIDAYNTALREYQADKYNYDMNKWSVENCMIPKTQMQLDQIVHSIVKMINDAVAPANPDGTKSPDAPYNLYGEQGYDEIFQRKYVPRWDPVTGELLPEEDGDFYTYYSIGNIQINPKLLETEGGYNWMAFAQTPTDLEDRTVLEKLLKDWISDSGPYAIEISGVKYGIQDAYQKFITNVAVEIEEANNYVKNQSLQVVQADNKRNTVMGVSLDEEMSHMMTYQYAYNAAARIFNVIDSMIDKVVNGTGRSGL